MGYKHDIFISYTHDEGMESWVHQHFVPFVRSFVGNALNRPVDIFIDRKGIANGDSWPLRLSTALARSRCLVPVWTPLYFHSAWCRKECAAMLQREIANGFRTPHNPSGLILPVTVFDGEFFPKRTREIQWLDCKRYWIVGDGFVKTERYVDFQDSLRDWSADVARAIAQAPSWESAWPEQRLEQIHDADLHPVPSTNFHFVGLE